MASSSLSCRYVNLGKIPSVAAHAQVTLAQLGFNSSVSSVNIRDVWNHAELPNRLAAGHKLEFGGVLGHDSRFYLLTPVN